MYKDTEKFRREFVYRGCTECSCAKYTKVIADSVPLKFKQADVLFIGVNPGAQEAVQGIPFCGPAGQLLRKVAQSELHGKVLAFTNVCLCSTNNEAGIPDGVFAHCRENLRSICKFFRPKIYVPCGNTAMHEIGIEGSISRNQGQIFERKGAKIIPCLHPSAILRGFSNRDALQMTMRTIAKEL